MAEKREKASVLFVCLGNICRSPTAHAVFEGKVNDAGLSDHIIVDSCGTAAYHVGERPDSRSALAARQRGYKTDHLRARQLEKRDFEMFDFILAMDKENLANIKRKKPAKANANISLFMDFHDDESIKEVPDPYYGGESGFEYVLDLVELASDNLLSRITTSLK